jgi:hypothetical protein
MRNAACWEFISSLQQRIIANNHSADDLFTEPEGPLQCSQHPYNAPSPELQDAIQNLLLYIILGPILILFSNQHLRLQCGFIPSRLTRIYYVT